MKRKVTASIVTAAMLAFASCQTTKTGGLAQATEAEGGGSTVKAPQALPKAARSDERLARRVNAIIMKNEMLLGPEDLLEIKVKDHPELTTTAPVDPWGFIQAPYLRPVQVNGLTEGMVEDVLTQQYAEFFRQPPEVEVTVVQYNSQVVYVLGSVNSPGRYPLIKGKPMTLRDAIVNAGLPRPEAALWRTWVIRQSPEGGTTKTYVDMNQILFRGHLENNLELNAGDIVYLPMGVIDAVVFFIGRIFSPITGVARRVVVPAAP